jgi:hypothetical protein
VTGEEEETGNWVMGIGESGFGLQDKYMTKRKAGRLALPLLFKRSSGFTS